MLTIVFNKLSTPMPIRLEAGKRYTIYGAIQLLTELEVKYQSQQLIKTIEFQLFDGSVAVYEDKIEIGVGHGSELISYIEERLSQLFPNQKEDINQLLDKVNDSYLAFTTLEPPVDSEIKPAEVKSIKEVKEPVTPPIKKKKVKSKVSKPVNLKKIGLIFFISFFTCSLIGAGTVVLYKWPKSTNVSEIESIDTLLEQENYGVAGELYATKHSYIENYIFDVLSKSSSEAEKEKHLENLKEFTENYPTEQGSFDLAYLSKEYQGVVERKTAADTDNRLAMLGFSLVKVGDVAAATELNKELKSSGLEKMIAQYDVFEKQINFYKDQLKTEGLTQTEKEKFESMQHYYEVQQKTLGESTNEG